MPCRFAGAAALLILTASPKTAAQTLTSHKLFRAEEDRRGQVINFQPNAQPAAMEAFRTQASAVTAEEGKQKDVLLLIPTVPVTFNSLEKDSTGTWRLGAAMTAGVGATFVLGKATYEGATSTVHPWVIAGAAINTGLTEKPDRGVTEALNVSGFFGFGNVAVSFARDVLHGRTAIGLSLKTDALTNLAPDAYACFRGCS